MESIMDIFKAIRGVRLSLRVASFIFTSLFVLTIPGFGCSIASCNNDGIETRRGFIVRVLHDGRPLAGVSVHVATYTQDQPIDRFSGKTDTDGIVRVMGLIPGNYWLSTDLLGISAGGGCFHVGVHSSWKAKRKVSYEWGELATATRRIAGKLIDSQPGYGESPIMNLIHRIDVPIVGAKMRLQDPLTGKTYGAVSDDSGDFSFDSAPQGIYVLHIDGGFVSKDRDYDSTDLLIRRSDTANPNSILLKRREAGGGSCGGTYLDLQNASK
jgi:hypothetical protein